MAENIVVCLDFFFSSFAGFVMIFQSDGKVKVKFSTETSMVSDCEAAAYTGAGATAAIMGDDSIAAKDPANTDRREELGHPHRSLIIRPSAM
mmetsp:Transcript_8837/g.12621  ORF Transcript_8837/g.12621 Transcript_8837/m.12621 type:complete len:92 (+) Transcript_8837:135-410(+)